MDDEWVMVVMVASGFTVIVSFNLHKGPQGDPCCACGVHSCLASCCGFMCDLRKQKLPNSLCECRNRNGNPSLPDPNPIEERREREVTDASESVLLQDQEPPVRAESNIIAVSGPGPP